MAMIDSSKVFKAAGAASTAAPYVRRLMSDERLRDELRNLIRSANHLYGELSGDDAMKKLVEDDAIRKDVDRMLESMQKAGQRAMAQRKSTNWMAIAIVSGIAGAIAALLVYPRTRHGIQGAVDNVRGRSLHVVEDTEEKVA